MTEENPFAAFAPGASPVEATPTADKPKRGRKKAAPRAVTNTDIKQAVEKKTRKSRVAKPARPVTIPIGLLPALGGLNKDETSMLMSLIGNLHSVPKKARGRLVMALGKIFL